MKLIQIFIIVILGIAHQAQPVNCRVSSRSSRGSRSMSRAARSATTMRSSRRRRNGPYSLGEAQIGKYRDDNSTCAIERVHIMSNSDLRHTLGKFPYCTNKMQKDCRVCNGETYHSHNLHTVSCCPGIVGRDGLCYTYHIRDVKGDMCDKILYKLDSSGQCYLAYPVLMFFQYVSLTLLFATILGFITLFFALIISCCACAYEH